MRQGDNTTGLFVLPILLPSSLKYQVLLQCIGCTFGSVARQTCNIAGLQHEPFSHGCIIDDETIYESLNGN